jgi:hypothetical protein
MIRPNTGGKTFRVLSNKKPPLPTAPTPTPPIVKPEPKPVELVDKPKKPGPGRPRKTPKVARPPNPPKERKFIKERYKRRNAVGLVVTTPAGHQIFTDKWGVENIKLHITKKPQNKS